MELYKKIGAYAAEYDMLPAGGRVLVAVSGGRDSMVLLHLLLELQKEKTFHLAVCHFNHQLRGDESDGDEVFVEAHCRDLGLPFIVDCGDVEAHAEAAGESIETAARSLRYAFFEAALEEFDADRLVTAHHADDNAETLLINLIRGAGLQGLTGIPPRRGKFVRPLLGVTREQLAAYGAAHSIPYREDSSNENTDFLRNRLRQEVMPILEELNPQLTGTLGKTLRLLRRDNDYLNARAYELFTKARPAADNFVISAKLFASTPAPIATRTARRIFEEMGEMTPAARLEDIFTLAAGSDPSGFLQLGGGLLVQRVYDDLLFTTEDETLPAFQPVNLNLDGETAINGLWRATCAQTICPAEREEGVNYLTLSVADEPLLVRSRKIGDGLTLRSSGGRKTVKKLFIDEKLPRREREQVPVLERDGACIAVGRFGAELAFHAAAGEACLRLEFIQKKNHKQGSKQI